MRLTHTLRAESDAVAVRHGETVNMAAAANTRTCSAVATVDSTVDSRVSHRVKSGARTATASDSARNGCIITVWSQSLLRRISGTVRSLSLTDTPIDVSHRGASNGGSRRSPNANVNFLEISKCD